MPLTSVPMPSIHELAGQLIKLADKEPTAHIDKVEACEGDPLCVAYDPETGQTITKVEWITTITIKQTVTRSLKR